MRTFTVAELAERIARPGERPDLMADRIRNWTKDSLLEPLGDKNPGTGRSRSYPEKALIEALVLLELMDCLGVQPIKARWFAGWAKAAKILHEPTDRKKYLIFSRSGEITGIELRDPKELLALLQDSPAFAAHIIIDLEKLYARIEQKPETA
ncbi:hypothetical protein [Afipia sp. GAS231]|uniref:hypothetical protein n=1 Tax=Afipia sp. GAS231 TaxID=1882747 RepID=UPI00087D9ABF|nr:hypothetical protein [Afipia sp. GAS231]SDP49239.1 hypothetical protein SAMN05444050_7045 [Afipia sp. GAS231]